VCHRALRGSERDLPCSVGGCCMTRLYFGFDWRVLYTTSIHNVSCVASSGVACCCLLVAYLSRQYCANSSVVEPTVCSGNGTCNATSCPLGRMPYCPAGSTADRLCPAVSGAMRRSPFPVDLAICDSCSRASTPVPAAPSPVLVEDLECKCKCK